jgi:hypothetical protein
LRENPVPKISPLPNDSGVVTVLHDVTSLKDADRIGHALARDASGFDSWMVTALTMER